MTEEEKVAELSCVEQGEMHKFSVMCAWYGRAVLLPEPRSPGSGCGPWVSSDQLRDRERLNLSEPFLSHLQDERTNTYPASPVPR